MQEAVNENYYEMKAKISSQGSIKDIVNNPDLIKRIIAYNGDRHFLCAFIDLVNEELEKGTLDEGDLSFFRSGEFADAIVHLKETIEKVEPREMQVSERLDKVNYMSLLHDPISLAVSYTHPEIISALCGEAMDYNPRDLTWWVTSGTYSSLPGKVQMTILNEVLKKKDLDVAQELASIASYGLTPYQKDEELRR